MSIFTLAKIRYLSDWPTARVQFIILNELHRTRSLKRIKLPKPNPNICKKNKMCLVWRTTRQNCPIFQDETEISKIKTENRTKYAEAKLLEDGNAL